MAEAHRVQVVVTGPSGVPPNQLRPALRHQALKGVYVEYRAQGLTAREIADALSISRYIVYGDLAALGLSPGRNHAPKHLRKTIEISAQVRKARTAARTEKTCPRCPEKGPQPLSAFAANKGTADGRRGWCRSCDNANRRKPRAPKATERVPANASMPTASVGQGTAALPKALPRVADGAELLATAVVVEWRLNVPRDEARRVAVLIKTGQRKMKDGRAAPAHDRVDTAIWTDLADLEQLAATVGVFPRPGMREPAHPASERTIWFSHAPNAVSAIQG